MSPERRSPWLEGIDLLALVGFAALFATQALRLVLALDGGGFVLLALVAAPLGMLAADLVSGVV